MLRLLAFPALLALPLLASGPAVSEPPRGVAGPIEAAVVKVRDGDTIEVEAFIWPSQAVHTAVRLRGVDAPEMKGQCPAEREAAVEARDRLVALVGDGTVRLTDIEGDKYFGRVLADIATNSEPNVAAKLKREGLVGAYDGGKRRDWCTAAGATVVGKWLGRG